MTTRTTTDSAANTRLTRSRVVITNTTQGTVLADHAEVACGFLKRMVGLLTRQALPEGAALVIPNCRSIHTYFMRFPIDVLFLRTIDTASRGPRHTAGLRHSTLVVEVVEHLRPFRFAWASKADTVIELPDQTIARTSTCIGELMTITGPRSSLGMGADGQ